MFAKKMTADLIPLDSCFLPLRRGTKSAGDARLQDIFNYLMSTLEMILIDSRIFVLLGTGRADVFGVFF